MAKNGKKAAKEDDSHICSKGKADEVRKKTEWKTSTGKVMMNFSYKDLFDPCKGYVNQREAEAFKVLMKDKSTPFLETGHFDVILKAAEKMICMSTEKFNTGCILGTVCTILAHLNRHCDSEDRLKQVESFVSSMRKKFREKKIQKAILQVKPSLRSNAVALLKPIVQDPAESNAAYDVERSSIVFDLKSSDEEPNGHNTSNNKLGLMRKILQLFQHSEENAMKQLIGLHFQTFKMQSNFDEIDALGEVVRVLLNMDPQRENLHLIFDCLVWMQKLSSKSQKRRELTRAAARDFCKRRGTQWVIKWIAENAQAEDLPVGVELVVNSFETIDLSSECITELLKKNDFVPTVQESIAKRFSDFDDGAKEDLVQQIVKYLQNEDLSPETSMNEVVGHLLVNLLWMTYYDNRLLFNLLFETLTTHAADLHQYTCYKTVALLYTWFKTGTVSPFLVHFVKGKPFWFRERSPLLFFEFCLAVTEPYFLSSICKEFKKCVHVYFFNPGGALFVQYVLSPPSIAFNDTLKRRTQEERLTTIESLRKALIPCLRALISETPAEVYLWCEVRCLLTSKLIMNLNDPKILRNVVKMVTNSIVTSMACFTVDNTFPWILRLLRENIAMDAFLYSVQMTEAETEYFSDLFVDFFPPKDFIQHSKDSPVWRSLILMLIETGIPTVLSKVKNRLKDLEPPTRMNSSEEIEFWQTVLGLD